MAFLRVEKKKSGTYLRIIESYREGKISRHETLFNLGRLEDYKADQLERIARKLLELSGCPLESIDKLKIKELGRYNYGYPIVVKKLWNNFRLSDFFSKALTNYKIQYNFIGCIQLMLIERLNEPCSKKRNYEHQQEYLGLEKIEIQWLYRSLDILCELSDNLQKYVFEQLRNLFQIQVDVVFYDVTTLYFSSKTPQDEKDIRQSSYSKDGRHKNLQVVLGLMVDKERNPIGFKIYQGKKWEGHTFIDAVQSLKERFNIEQVVVVADSGMLDDENLKLLEKNQMQYIVGDRLKTLPKKVQEILLKKTDYQTTQVMDDQKKETYFSWISTDYNNRKIICTYSAKRARKDVKEREKQVEKAKRYIQQPNLLKAENKRGHRKYLVSNPTGELQINNQKIESDQKYDGYKAICTNIKEFDIHEILEQYRNLFEVEHAFRTMKSVIKARPVFVWNENRIKGHLTMCYLAYLFLNRLRMHLKWSEDKILGVIDKMQVSEIKQEASENTLYLRSKMTEEIQHIAKQLKIQIMNDTCPKNLINNYLK